MSSNIKKLYVSNILTGLVFWYGIEKLFMGSIGITAFGIGIAASLSIALNLLLDIPSGIIADRWSRKGMLLLSTVFMALSSITLGFSNSLDIYLVGYVFYSLYVVSTSGTYQAIMYDSLHETGNSGDYSRIMGRAYALFLGGAGIANILSGFIADNYGYRIPFYLTVFSCIANFVIISTIREPVFHKTEGKEKILKHLGLSTKSLARSTLLRSLAIILSALTIIELFKSDFGQVYMLRYVTTPQLLGLLWAGYAFTWSFGSLIAHKLKTKITLLIWLSTVPIVLMSLIDSRVSLFFFMVQAIAAAALVNLVETLVQDSTPSQVRASIMSVLSSLGRLLAVPASLIFGFSIRNYSVIWTLKGVALVGVFIVIYWTFVTKKYPQKHSTYQAEDVPSAPITPANLT